MKEREFFNQKLNVIRKMKENDKSRIKKIDKKIKKILDLLNNSKNFYTTSSCSGRIMLLEIDRKNRKDKTNWLFSSHDKVSFRELSRGLKNYKTKKEVWFKQEPMILHICCKNLNYAKKLIKAAGDSGFKKTGIIALSKRIIVEIKDSEYISTLVANQGKIIVTDDYLKELLKKANQKLCKNLEKINRLNSNIREII